MNAVTLGALIAAIAPLVAIWISLRERNEQSIEDRVEQLENLFAACQETNDALRRENYELQRRIITLEKGDR